MASDEHRKFYYDWHEGKYKLSDEKIHRLKEMDCKRHDHGYRIDKDNAGLYVENSHNMLPSVDVFLKKQNEDKVVKNSDVVDSGRGNQANKSKESQTRDGISKGHKVMTSVLSTRLLRLNAAQTLWHKDMNSFIEYILRLDDDAVIVDILPILTKRVKDDGPELSTLSMGACLDLLPVLGKLLDSKYEDYIIAAIDMVREVMKRWWKELQTIGKNEKKDIGKDFRCSRSVNGVYMLLISMTDRLRVLAKRSGKIGEKAKVLQELMALL
ncbi:Hypothetical predicted protein [Paramuricea clavata]|uniref:Uncharacterized protein n=1 Tax=Paramuricea clavata TaxID=317549 RepID=A0A6S7GE81_PARCT|nr:Hypothetical predicted protein [Paramuricea clavata]